MHLAYCDESADEKRTVAAAVVVPEASWRSAFDAIRDFRRSLRAKYGIPLAYELHAHPLVAGKGMPGNRTRPLGRKLGGQIFLEAIETLNTLGSLGVYGINVSVKNSDHRKPLRQSMMLLFQRIENNLTKTDNYGLIIYDGQETQRRTLARQILRRMNVYNPVPSLFGVSSFRNLPVKRILGDPFNRDSADDVLIQMADMMAFALLRQDNPPTQPVTLAAGVQSAFARLPDIWLRAASRSDSQGVVR